MNHWHRKLLSRGLVEKARCIIQTFSDTVSQMTHTHTQEHYNGCFLGLPELIISGS